MSGLKLRGMSYDKYRSPCLPYKVIHAPCASDGVDLKWVDGHAPAAIPCGTSFGVPWAQGEIDRTTAVAAQLHLPVAAAFLYKPGLWHSESIRF